VLLVPRGIVPSLRRLGARHLAPASAPARAHE
jgi:hypothetical protein